MNETQPAGTNRPETRRQRALLFAHSPDHRGHCHSCPGERWPCRTRAALEPDERARRDTAEPA